MGGKYKDRSKQSNHFSLFLFVAGSRVFSRSSRIHKRMSLKNVIKKLQKLAKEKETQRSEHKQK
jgi:hypothetical protein